MRMILLALFFSLTGCAATPDAVSYSDTMEIIRDAAQQAPAVVSGDYVLLFKAAGNKGGYTYLNTELDYRDQRNVTVALTPSMSVALQIRYGLPPAAFFVGKSVRIKGEARQEKIYLFCNGRVSSKYYYQTHINVSEMSQLEVL
ncbi:hypothetical protein [Shewanella sp. YIC-542]|uniref:hypothetical protein n=1 Tax=Shewanella mytili TaxID=3377111 RepID=UPI00398EBF4B